MKDYRSQSYKKIASSKKSSANSSTPSSVPSTSNPSSGSGVRLASGGFASAGVSVYSGSKTNGGATPEVVGDNANYQGRKGESGNLINSAGETVQVKAKEQSSYSNTAQERINSLKSANSLNVSQQNELQAQLQREQPINVQMDYKSVNDLNSNNPRAKEIFNSVRNDKINNNENSKINNNDIQSFSSSNVVAPRNTNQGETISLAPSNDFIIPSDNKKYAGVINVNNNETSFKNGFDVGGVLEFNYLESASISLKKSGDSGNVFAGLFVVPFSYGVGFVKGVQDVPKFVINTFQERPPTLNPVANFYYAGDVLNKVGAGSVEFVGDVANNVKSGNVVGLSYNVGYIQGGSKAGELGLKPIKSVAKDLSKVGEAPSSLKKSIKFQEATESTYNPLTKSYEPITDVAYTFKKNVVKGEYDALTNTFQPPRRVGVLVPAEVSSQSLGLATINKNGISQSLKVSELQTQLYEKSLIQQSEPSLFVSSVEKPSSLLEMAKQNPELARRIASENSQQVFNSFENSNPPKKINNLYDLTPEERLAISKKQAGLNQELQTTLGSIVPENKAEVFVFQNGRKVAKFEKGSIELFGNKKGQAQLINPSQIIEEGSLFLNRAKGSFEKFKRESDLTNPLDNNLDITKSRIYSPIILRNEGKSFIASRNLGDIKISSLNDVKLKSDLTNSLRLTNSLKRVQEDVYLPKYRIASKSKVATATAVNVASAVEQSSEIGLGLKQDSIQELRQTPQPKLRNPLNPKIKDPNLKQPKLKLSFPIKEKNKSLGSFSVEVRKKGVFKSLGSYNSEREAFNKGLSDVRNSASASFRIKNLSTGDLVNDLTSNDLTTSKRNKGIYVQKNKYRISSQGEKSEITYKGIFSNRSKNKKNKRSVF